MGTSEETRNSTWKALGSGISRFFLDVSGFAIRIVTLGLWDHLFGIRVQESKFRDQGSGIRVLGSGYWVQASIIRVLESGINFFRKRSKTKASKILLFRDFLGFFLTYSPWNRCLHLKSRAATVNKSIKGRGPIYQEDCKKNLIYSAQHLVHGKLNLCTWRLFLDFTNLDEFLTNLVQWL